MMMRFNRILILLCAAFTWGAWANELTKNDYDLPPLKGHKRSLIQWEKDPSELTDIKRWILERDIRDLEPGWKVRERLSAHAERVGKVISCIGDCQLYRGTTSGRVRWLSRIEEGDEIHTGKDSYLWAMLIDGTLVRLAPESALGFLEVNIGADKVFFHARLNQGYVHWQPRSGRAQKLTDAPETDPLFLPLMDEKANVQWFQQRQYQGETDAEQIAITFGRKPLGQSLQQKDLNDKIAQNNSYIMKRMHRYLLVAPNGSVIGEDAPISWYYGVASQSFFRVTNRDEEEEGERTRPMSAKYYFRGYSNDRVEDLPYNQWMAVDSDGREMIPLGDIPSQLAVSDLMPRRITTLMLAREHWLAKSRELWEKAENTQYLATEWGYRLWGGELDTRLNFLREYTRRIETTNLRSLQRLTESLSKEGQFKVHEFDGRYFTRALDAYYMSVKRRHSYGKDSVRDMIPLHYYGWMLKNARQQ